jgi:formylglycine-generating enzyme required for sulfatase activity
MRTTLGSLLLLCISIGVAGAQVPPPKPKPRVIPPAVERERPRPHEDPASAALLIVSDAPCRLWVDERRQGSLDAGIAKRVTVTPGSHLIVVTGHDSEVRQELTVDVERDQQLVVRVTLAEAIRRKKAQEADLSDVRAAAEERASRARHFAEVPWQRFTGGAVSVGCVPIDTTCLADERPRRPVPNVPPFDMMPTEVTVQQFAAVIGIRRMPQQPAWNDQPDHPVVNVRWDEARAFCASIRARLPREAEWEYAARAMADDQIYPWGDVFVASSANAWGTPPGDRWEHTAPVASFPPTRRGLFDVAGNVWEWVTDVYVNDDDKSPTAYRIARGGSWRALPTSLRTSARARFNPEQGDESVGFRCVRDVPPTGGVR